MKKGEWYRARAPLRLSFGGGGTEIEPYLSAHGGVILNTTINRYVYATMTLTNDEVIFESVDLNITEKLSPASYYPPQEGALSLHRAAYNHMVAAHHGGKPLPLHLCTYSDAPVGSGLGSSSTLMVAVVRCFDEALGLALGEYDLASLAHKIERRDLGLSGGYQDHYAAAFGGFNFMEFRTDGTVIVNPLRIRFSILAELEYALMLFFTGISRDSSSIIDVQSSALTSDPQVIAAAHKIKALAFEMKDYLLVGDIKKLALTLHESWLAKRSTAAAISNDEIDDVYGKARAAGVWGGKVSGAGGGGFMMLITDPARRAAVLQALPNAGAAVSSCTFTDEGASAWRTKK